MGLNRTPCKDQRWRHYKGQMYEIVCIATNEADLESVVVYRHIGATRTWVRTLANFLETIRRDTDESIAKINRFERVS